MSLAPFERATVVANLEDTAQEVARRMRDYRVGSVVVVRASHPIGIITDRDLAVRVVAEGRDPATIKVEEIVTYDAATIPRSAGVDTAVRMMREHGVRRLPIVDDDSRIVGIVTADDLIVLFARRLADLGEGIGDNVDAGESR